MTTLPDPRCFAATTDDAVVRLAVQCVRAASARSPGAACLEVVARLRECAADGRDDEIGASLHAATSAPVYRCLWESLARAVAPDTSAGVLALPFAFPLLIVTGGRVPASVPGVLADARGVQDLLEASGALGQARNFGLGAGLCSLAPLEALAPSRLYALSRAVSPGVLDLPADPIAVTASDEQVHLRFLLGAALIPAHAPSFLETGSAVTAWGMALTRELSQQLRVDGVSVLPIPRPPAALLRAPELGRRARDELAYQAFVSRVLRRFRAEVGEPDVTVAALDCTAIGVRFASAFVEDRVDVHAWPLHPLDDLQEVAGSILGLLQECRVQNVQVLSSVVSAEAFSLKRVQ